MRWRIINPKLISFNPFFAFWLAQELKEGLDGLSEDAL